jgi:hypothetical protein
MNNKSFIFVLLFLIITVSQTQAQNLPANLWASPQSTTTEGRYRSNADDFIRPDAYTGVKFNKWFGMVSFLQDEIGGAIATTGFATKVSNIYIGAFYSGNLWSGTPVNNYNEEEPFTKPNGGETGKTYNVYDTISVSGVTNPVNNVALLIGWNNMGFRLTYRTNYQVFNENDIVTKDENNAYQLYKSYYDESGYIAPQIAWAMSKDLTKNGIRPYAAVDLVFYRDYQKTETNGADTNGITGEKIGRSLNHFDPSLSVGLGGYTFYNEDGFKASADFDYVLTFNIYDNEYSYTENGVYKTGKITGTYSPGSNPYVQEYFISNLLTPSVSGSWNDDRLALKFKLNLPLTFSSRIQDSMALNDGNLIYDGASNTTFTFTLRPDLRLAMQYKIIPNRLTLNSGARIQATAITMETINQESYTLNKRNYGRKIHQDSFGSNFINRFSIGPTFNFTEKAWVEATTGVTNAYGNEGTIDVFAPGGLFSFGSILVALKF